MEDQCDHLKEFLDAEIKVIKKHIEKHKWFNHINDENEGITDFVKKYGWLMREMYCNFVCDKKDGCKIKDIPNEL